MSSASEKPEASPNGDAVPARTVLGIPVTFLETGDAARILVRQAMGRSARTRGIAVHLCNAYTLALADESDEYRALLRRGDINFADGWALPAFAGSARENPERLFSLRGADLMREAARVGEALGTTHFLLGGTPDVLVALRARLVELVPSIDIVGYHSPPFGVLTAHAAAQQWRALSEVNADIVWVGLGTPKQDWAVDELAQTHEGCFVAVGAAFNYVSGYASEAPGYMQTAGLEWLFRLVKEPRRLWRRYFWGNTRFLAALIRERRA